VAGASAFLSAGLSAAGATISYSLVGATCLTASSALGASFYVSFGIFFKIAATSFFGELGSLGADFFWLSAFLSSTFFASAI